VSRSTIVASSSLLGITELLEVQQVQGILRGIFVTGTDTGIGKTVVSAALMHRYGGVPSLRYWKPIQTGIEEDDDTETIARLSGCDRERLLQAGVRLPRPLSPHLAARLAGTAIDAGALLALAAAQPPSHRWIVEGAGGLLVPIDDRTLMVDLIARLGLSVVVVARSSLGTINHTLLTLEGLRGRSIPVAGVIMTGERNIENRMAIEHYGHVSVLGELPVLTPLTTRSLQQAAATLDPRDVLRVCFGETGK
jgi:dethiobiotin synthase